jgi:hypothetical protein
MDDGGVSEHADLPPRGNNGRIADRAAAEVFEDILLGKGLARVVVLHVVVGEDFGEHSKIGGHERAVSGFVQGENLLFVGEWLQDCGLLQ